MTHPPKPSRVRIEDVARLAGVSTATVSRVLNNSAPVSEEMKLRIQQAIEELSYTPSDAARALASQRTNTIGLMVHEISSPVLPPLLRGVEAITRENGFNLLVATVGDSQNPDIFISPVGEHNTDGLLVYASSMSQKQLIRLNKRNFPIVLMHQHIPDTLDIPTVNIENIDSARQLVNHLVQVHHRQRIAFLTGPLHQNDGIEREKGYRQGLVEHGITIDPSLIGYGGFDEIISYQTVSEWLRAELDIDAIFAADDESARGALQAIKDAGRRVPEDIAVVGFDDDPLARHLSPPLTTVSVPVEQVGRQAAQRLLLTIADGKADSVLLSTRLIIRQSCGCVPTDDAHNRR